MTHERNTRAMQQSARCGARTRKGAPCKSPAVQGKNRCRMHGGAAGSGAPMGNQNALKHGLYTAESKAFTAYVRKTLRRGKEHLE
jgi:uncharacterized protein YjcR